MPIGIAPAIAGFWLGLGGAAIGQATCSTRWLARPIRPSGSLVDSANDPPSTPADCQGTAPNKMASAVAPGLQHHLVAAQAGGQGLHTALEAALDACGIAAAGPTAALRRLLLARPHAAAVLAAAANASGHPCAAGTLLARLLSGSLVGAGELLAAADPAQLAMAVAQLHAFARCSALPAPAAAAAQAAFVTLVKLLATSGDGEEHQRAAERIMAHLRRAWLLPAAGALQGGTAAPGNSRSCSDAPSLLAAAVDAVDAEVFPRHLAHRQAQR